MSNKRVDRRGRTRKNAVVSSARKWVQLVMSYSVNDVRLNRSAAFLSLGVTRFYIDTLVYVYTRGTVSRTV